jgi:hypothetical protein
MAALGTERRIHRQWRDEQRESRYPFADGASLQTSTGLDLGYDTFLDGHLYPIGGSARLFLSEAIVSSSNVTLWIGNTGTAHLAAAEFDPRDPPELLAFYDSVGRPAGVLVADGLSLARFQGWERATHVFAEAATEFAASICCPLPEIGVRGFLTPDGDILTGEVWLVGENGLVVREDPDVTTGNGVVLRIDVVGDPLFRRALCNGVANNPGGEVPLFQPPRLLRTINHQPPDEFGNFTLTVGRNVALAPILRIQPQDGEIRIYLVGQGL